MYGRTSEVLAELATTVSKLSLCSSSDFVDDSSSSPLLRDLNMSMMMLHDMALMLLVEMSVEVRHIGQLQLCSIHRHMQSKWNMWPHLLSRPMTSLSASPVLAVNFSRQMEHRFSCCLFMRYANDFDL